MTQPFIYCPQCWPADLGEYDTDHCCLDCGTPVLVASQDKIIELLMEQNEALSEALQQAMDALGAGTLSLVHRPALRLVHSRRKSKPRYGDRCACGEPIDDTCPDCAAGVCRACAEAEGQGTCCDRHTEENGHA